MMRSSSNNPDGLQPESTGLSLQLGDVYYILFRRKWLILFFAVLGLAAAASFRKFWTPLYSSQAKLMVHYVVEPRAGVVTGPGDVRTPDIMGDTIMNAEIEILSSFDQLRQVAAAVGPAQIIGAPTNGMPQPELLAAAIIQGNLKIAPPGRGNVLVVEFFHADPETVQQVLLKVIDFYFLKHKQIHRPPAMSDALAKTVDELRSTIADMEDKLRKLKTSADVVSIEDTMKANLNLISDIRRDLNAAKAELAERQASLMRLTNSIPARVSTATNTVAATNEIASGPSANSDAYRRLIGQLEFYEKQELQLAIQVTETNALLRDFRVQIAELRRERKRLEDADASLLLGPQRTTTMSAAQPSSAAQDSITLAVFNEASRVVGLTAKIQELTNQLAAVRREATKVEEVENQIHEYQRTKEFAEEKLRKLAGRVADQKTDETFGPGQLPNISRIQEPSPPTKNYLKHNKIVLGLAGGGLGLGLALAFLIELILNQTVRRPLELQKKLRLPVFLNVPRLRRLRPASRKRLAAPMNGAQAVALPATTTASSVMQPYCDALRDRLIHYFQKNNMTHKPKLVAVTGCGDGVGVSTIAAGLAASLSETGDGNVLLVDANLSEGAAHPFHRGKPACGLNDVLKEELRGDAQVQDHLYVATASESDGALIKALPKRFSQLVPKLKASDYDYIIFDMPPVTQTSITAKLAGFMDIVMLVVESERTGRSIVSEASDLLRDSRANVATVLNKTKRYVPSWVHREFE